MATNWFVWRRLRLAEEHIDIDIIDDYDGSLFAIQCQTCDRSACAPEKSEFTMNWLIPAIVFNANLTDKYWFCVAHLSIYKP